MSGLYALYVWAAYGIARAICWHHGHQWLYTPTCLRCGDPRPRN